ncbi:hypothetical protein V2J09_013358 [Rumex salicifolius]
MVGGMKQESVLQTLPLHLSPSKPVIVNLAQHLLAPDSPTTFWVHRTIPSRVDKLSAPFGSSCSSLSPHEHSSSTSLFPQAVSNKILSEECELFLYKQFKEKVEMPVKKAV